MVPWSRHQAAGSTTEKDNDNDQTAQWIQFSVSAATRVGVRPRHMQSLFRLSSSPQTGRLILAKLLSFQRSGQESSKVMNSDCGCLSDSGEGGSDHDVKSQHQCQPRQELCTEGSTATVSTRSTRSSDTEIADPEPNATCAVMCQCDIAIADEAPPHSGGAGCQDRAAARQDDAATVDEAPPPASDDESWLGRTSDGEGESWLDRKRGSDRSENVGAEQVHERAPGLNRLTFLGGRRRSACARRRRERAARRRDRGAEEGRGAETGSGDEGERPRAATTDGEGEDRAGQSGVPAAAAEVPGGGGEGGAAAATVHRPRHIPYEANTDSTERIDPRTPKLLRYRSSQLLQASLVHSDCPQEELELVAAERVGYLENHWKPLALVLCTGLMSLAIILSLTVTGDIQLRGTEAPSPAPTFDPRPMLERVRERGRVRCGLLQSTINTREGFHYDLVRRCRPVRRCSDFLLA